MKILVVGGGAREHALCWAIAASPLCDALYCAPGNAGIAQEATCVPIGAEDIEELLAFVGGLQVIGPTASGAAAPFKVRLHRLGSIDATTDSGTAIHHALAAAGRPLLPRTLRCVCARHEGGSPAGWRSIRYAKATVR